eukprot:scaffold3161_cov21-Tisochrysis_lutea.AAC.1
MAHAFTSSLLSHALQGSWCERLLKSMYYVTQRHGPAFPFEIERLWSTLAASKRNIIPILDFLTSLGVYAALQVSVACAGIYVCVIVCMCVSVFVRVRAHVCCAAEAVALVARSRNPPFKLQCRLTCFVLCGMHQWGEQHVQGAAQQHHASTMLTHLPHNESASLTEYFAVAKRIALYLARISPQHTIDHLAYEISLQVRLLGIFLGKDPPDVFTNVGSMVLGKVQSVLLLSGANS